MTAAVKKIIRSMDEHPEQWELALCTLMHRSSKMEIWIANDPFYYRVYRPEEVRFNLLDKVRFALALRRWRAKQPKQASRPKPTLDDCAALLDQVKA